MIVYFWGTRGSLPAALTAQSHRQKIFRAVEAARGLNLDSDQGIYDFIDTKLPFAVSRTYGSNTSCIEIKDDTDGDEYILCDAGSGIRDFASQWVKAGHATESHTFHILMTHLHWDHVMGFPFFTPAYIPGNRIIFHGYHDTIPGTFKSQMDPPTFPVPFSMLGADIEFDIQPPCTPFNIGGFEITSIEQNHPGISYGFRFAKDGKSFVYSTDSEHKDDAYDKEYPFIKFFQDADLLVFDAQYSLADATFSKADWGHSSNVMGVELASRSMVKHLVMFHNEPTADDNSLDEFLFNTRMYSDIYHSESEDNLSRPQYPENISIAYDGMEIEI